MDGSCPSALHGAGMAIIPARGGDSEEEEAGSVGTRGMRGASGADAGADKSLSVPQPWLFLPLLPASLRPSSSPRQSRVTPGEPIPASSRQSSFLPSFQLSSLPLVFPRGFSPTPASCWDTFGR